MQLFSGDTPLFLAPMAGVTDYAFRTVCAEYPDAKAAFALMVQLPDVLEQNLGASGEDGYDLRQLPQDWYSCVIDLWRFVYPKI